MTAQSENIHGYSDNDFYATGSTTDVWVYLEFKNSKGAAFLSGTHIIANDGAKSMNYSYDGMTLHGTLLKSEVITSEQRVRRGVYVKSTVAGNPTTYRVWAY